MKHTGYRNFQSLLRRKMRANVFTNNLSEGVGVNIFEMGLTVSTERNETCVHKQ